MKYDEVISKIIDEISESYKIRTSKELTGTSLLREDGKVNFLGSVRHNLNNIFPEIIKAIKNNPSILELEIPLFNDPTIKKSSLHK